MLSKAIETLCMPAKASPILSKSYGIMQDYVADYC